MPEKIELSSTDSKVVAIEQILCGRIRILVLEVLSLRCLLDVQVELSSRQLYVEVWSSEGKEVWRFE